MFKNLIILMILLYLFFDLCLILQRDPDQLSKRIQAFIYVYWLAYWFVFFPLMVGSTLFTILFFYRNNGVPTTSEINKMSGCAAAF